MERTAEEPRWYVEFKKLDLVISSFYNLLFDMWELELIDDNIFHKYYGCLIRTDKYLLNLDNKPGDKIIGFLAGDNFSKLYYLPEGEKETLENIVILDLKNEKEIEFYREGWWGFEDIISIRAMINKKITEILSDIYKKEED